MVFDGPTKKAANSMIEKAIVISPDGYRYDIDGTEHKVGIGLVGENSLKGAKVIHNHTGPNADSFSKEDFAEFFNLGLDTLEVAYNEKRHRIQWDKEVERLTNDEALDIYRDAWYAIHDEVTNKGERVQAEKYEIMLYLKKNLKGFRFYEL